MLRLFLALKILLVTCSLAFAQDSARREEEIAKLIYIQLEKTGALLDDNTLSALVLRFRKTNPGVSEETWREVKSDVKALFVRVLSDPGGAFVSSVREVTPQFTTEDIEKLVAIHGDPVFRKYNDLALTAMKQPKAELAIRIAIERSVVEMNDLVMKHGLKPAY